MEIQTQIVFPAELDGMDVPLRCRVDVCAAEGGYAIDVELAGGAPEKTYDHPGVYHGRVIDWLTRPYIRFDGVDGTTGNLCLADTTLVLCAPPVPNPHFYGCLYERPAWPLRAHFQVESLPPDPLLVVGYAHYSCEVARPRAGGPTEVVVDPTSGRILDWNAGVGDDGVAVRFTSPPSPGLLGRLPATDPRHEEAAAYVRANHYFVEGEPCAVSVVVEHGETVLSDRLQLDCSLEDAFFRPLAPCCAADLEPSPCRGPRLTRVVGRVDLGTGLAVGVYHLRARLRLGNRQIEEYCAFEVMPASPALPAAPLQSGLPVLFSMPNEVRGLETDSFDPWHGTGDDVAHYTSVACYFPDFGASRRVADVLRVYGRKWFAWISSRTTDHPGWEEHQEVVKTCDYLFAPQDKSPRTDVRYYLARPGRYTGAVLDALRQFVRDTGARLEIPAGDQLPRPVFEALLATCWHDWLDYFARHFHEHILAPLWDRLRQLNPAVRLAGYGPYQAYVAHYKGAHHLRHFGLGEGSPAAPFWDGFMVFEDYPVACKYPIVRGTYQLASCKMALPHVPIYPEVYSRGVQGCPDGAVFHAWPPAGTYPSPDGTVRKRALEYVYAAVWFDGGRFRYWQDSGFQARNWDRRRYEVFLRTWRFVREHPPERPLRTAAFVSSEACCRAHGSRLSGGEEPAVYNTTEEASGWAYEMARLAGEAAGFVTRLEEVAHLTPADVHTLVLPPLHAVTPAQAGAIRRLHEGGVSLLGFEVVPGLEDLFGVVETAAAPRPGRQTLRPRTGAVISLPPELLSLAEQIDTADEPMRYTAAGARVLLEGEAPVLFCHRTSWGRTALYNLPPTLACRDEADGRFRDGADSVSELINRSALAILRELSQATVTTTAGKLIACRDCDGTAVIIVAEDAFPAEPHPIDAEVTLRLPGARPDAVRGDGDFAALAGADGTVTVSLHLEPHECRCLAVELPELTIAPPR